MDQLIRWLTDRLPESPAPTLVHNDYKLDNLMLDANWAPSGQGRVEAVLDWEMATVGDPLAAGIARAHAGAYRPKARYPDVGCQLGAPWAGPRGSRAGLGDGH